MIETVFAYVIVIFLVFLVAVVANGLEDKNKGTLNISFKETLDLTDLPIITFYNNGNKMNLILDSGANKSVIDSNVLKDYNYELNNYKGTVTGMEGNPIDVTYANIKLEYKDLIFDDVFQIVDMSAPFNSIKQESGATIHGILGNEFFRKYKYILDFKNFTAYTKK